MSPKPFSSRIRVDLDTRRFCIDDCQGIYHFTKIEGILLAYHYDVEIADEDHKSNEFRMGFCCGTAGPFDLKDDLTVDLRTGAFERTYRYDYGDVASVRHNLHYTGACKSAPFSGLHLAPR
jgi:hypothetical protein